MRPLHTGMYIAMYGYSLRLLAALFLEFSSRSTLSVVLEHAKVLLPFFAFFGMTVECLLSMPLGPLVPFFRVGPVREVPGFSILISFFPLILLGP